MSARVNRWTEILVAILYIVVSIGSAVGETSVYYLFGSAVVVVVLALIVGQARTWPRTTASG